MQTERRDWAMVPQPLISRARQALMLAMLSLTALLAASCGERGPFGSVANDDDSAAGDDDSAVDDDDSFSGEEGWELAFDVPPGAYAHVEWAAAYDGSLINLTGDFRGQRWDLATGAGGEVTLSGSPGGTHLHADSCQVDGQLYFLGGGGNGVFGVEWDYRWEQLDLTTLTWGEGGEHSSPVHRGSAARYGARCLLVGGGYGEPTVGVQALDTVTGQWSALPQLPEPRDFPYVAVLGDTLVVAGGARASQPGDTASTGFGVATADTWTLDLLDASAGWRGGPALPEAVARGIAYGESVGYGGSAARAGRVFVAGGIGNGGLGDLGWSMWSWAPGEDGWRDEGVLPEEPGPMRLLAYGGELLLVLADDDTGRLWRWGP